MTDKVKNILITIVFFSIIIGFFLMNVIKEDEQISISERRKLASFPEVSISKIFDGTFFKKFDDYTTDQFIKRETFRKLKVNTELNILRKNDYNNLYEYKGYIVENLYPLNIKSVNNVVNKINQIQEMYATSENNVYFTIVPDKNYFIDEDNLKLDYSKLEQIMKDGINAKYIPIKDELKIEDYYRTDSHWKQENIEKIADIILDNMQEAEGANYIQEEVATFRGTYSGRLPTNVEDKIIILTNDTIKNVKVFNYDKNENSKIYDYKKLNSLDKYDIYLSGATSLLTIENEDSSNDKELIIFRDSYGSSLAPLLVQAYRKITIVDIRYISPKLLSKYIEFKNQDILFIYSTILINNSFSLK